MTLLQLKYFLTVCKFQTVSDAATFLYVSQPSLSASIKELEKEFGVALFQRHHHGMTLTPEGETLYRSAQSLVEQAKQVETVMKDFSKTCKTLRLGVPPMIGSLILARIYRNFLQKYDNVRLEITEGGREELTKKLNDGLLDMVFLPHNKPIESRFSCLHVGSLEIVCCVTKNNSISKLNNVQMKQLASTPLVLFENSFFQTEEIKKRFAKEQINPNILLQTNQLSTLVNIISKDVAVGFVFKELIVKHENLIGVPLAEPMHVNVSLIWKKDVYFSNAMQCFKDFVANQNLLKSDLLNE